MQLSEDLRRRLDRLALATPAWRSWLTLLEEALLEVKNTAWDSLELSARADPGRTAPLLAHARIALDPSLGVRWVRRLLEIAARQDGGAAALLVGAGDGLDAGRFLEAALCNDRESLAKAGAGTGAAAEALGALAGLAASPLLQACRRRLASDLPEAWSQGYCPLCGSWPALAEVRGLERSIRLRCARCGGDWRGEWLRCPFCGTSDHERLGALVSEAHGETRKVETCGVCRGYLKTVTTLLPWPAEEVAIEDLATVDLDVAAIARGYTRPEGPGCVLQARLSARPARPAETPQPRRGFFRRRA